MTKKILKNKPLVEAIFELRWSLREQLKGIFIDPHYKIVIGRIYEKLNKEYPYHEQLSTASMPDEITGYVVQHRFRKDKNKWPLIQIGPGIMTINDTKEYIWEDFEQRAKKAVRALFSVYPESEKNLKINCLQLRYIDAINFNFENEDIFNFLDRYLKTKIVMYPNLFDNSNVNKLPINFDWRFAFRSSKPKGSIDMRFVKDKLKNIDVLKWETIVRSTSKEIPNLNQNINIWLKDAHNLTHEWFFKMIEGELERKFE